MPRIESVRAAGEQGDSPVKSISRAMRLLKILAGKPREGVMLVEIAKEAELGNTTTHRLLAALVEAGFAFQDPATRRYRLGSAAVLLGRQAHTHSVALTAQVFVERVATSTEDTAFVSVPEGRFSVCVARALGAFPIRSLALDVGGRRPLGVGAGSLAMLAAMTDERIDRVMEWNAGNYADFPSFDERTIRRMVDRTRREGFALNEGQVVKGMSAIGIAVLDDQGLPVAALSVSAISERLSGSRLKSVAKLLVREGEVMTKSLKSP
ncbi:MAG: IclR family transcriptional regulator [Ideonella sp.]|nr:IclR family transcriptional regulator [Ideonella sp.]